MNGGEKWALRWFKKADEDLLAAKAILNLEEPLPDVIGFHTQQCVEKYLKGFLSFHYRKIRRIHDLVDLLTECAGIDSDFTPWEDSCESLNDYAVGIRYPEMFYELSIEEAREAVTFAAQIKDFVRNKVGLEEK